MKHSTCVLHANDRIVFLGDSITEQQLYTNYVETYLATRFPEWKLRFFNAGWGGDTAPGGVNRLQRDVLALKPTIVTVCYGMNDGRCTLSDQEIRATYVNAMHELVARLKAAGVRPVLLTPGMVDEAVNPGLAAAHYNRRGLRVLADEVLKLAAAEQLPAGDLHTLMNEVDARAKAADPGFCMIPDAVHPDPAGHLVMAFGLLRALGVPPRRDRIDVDFARGAVAVSAGVRGARLEQHDREFFLNLRLDRLPFFVEPLARKVLPFLPFQETYNELLLRVSGLAAACASLGSEQARTGAVPRAQFEAGVNLFSQWSLAPLQRAADVHRYTVEKDQVYYKLWRILALNGGNGTNYNAAAHRAGIRLGPGLDRGRARLLNKASRACRLNVAAADLSGERLQDGDFISQWNCLGPFPKPYTDDRLGGEAAWTAAVPSLSVSWIACDLDLANPGANLIPYFGPKTDCFVYALTAIDSPVAQDAQLLAGSDDGLAVWLNGAQVWRNLDVARGVTPDQDVMPAPLRAGRNVLLLKITQGQGGWGFCVRFRGLHRTVTAQRLPAGR